MMTKNNISSYFAREVLLYVALIFIAFSILSYSMSELRIQWDNRIISEQLTANSDNLARQTARLIAENSELQIKLLSLEQRIQSETSTFIEIARQYDLRLIGIGNRKEILRTKTTDHIQTITFLGSIESSLNALNYMENELKSIIESISLSPSAESPNQVEMIIRFRNELMADGI
jgi:hypothetical protein